MDSSCNSLFPKRMKGKKKKMENTKKIKIKISNALRNT
jgi:hypothetical protein